MLGVVLAMTACNDELKVEEIEGLYEESLGLSISKYGYQTVNLVSTVDSKAYTVSFDFPEDESYELSFEIDSAGLDQYNTLYDQEYEILPEEYYDLQESVVLSAEDTSVTLTFYPSAMADDYDLSEASEFVLPLMVTVVGEELELNSKMTKALLKIELKVPTISVFRTEISQVVQDTIPQALLLTGASYNVDVVDESAITVAVNQSDVDSYNSTNGTAYPILPADNYSYTGISISEEVEGEMSFVMDLNANGLSAATYILPISLSSSTYEIEGGDLVYHLVTIEQTAPSYIAEFDLGVSQVANSEYLVVQASFDLAAAAAAFGTTEDELAANINFYGVNSNASLYRDGYTANVGYWYDTNGDVTTWGTENCGMFVEYGESTSTFNIGQFPDALSAWETYTVGMALSYNDMLILYNITLNVIPPFTATYDLSVDQAVNNEYVSVQTTFDFAEVAGLVGATEDELRSNILFYGINPDSNIIEGYTANNGFWYNNLGEVASWGAEGCTMFAEYANDGIFNVGQFPDATTAGDVYTVSMALVYGDHLVRFNITYNIQ